MEPDDEEFDPWDHTAIAADLIRQGDSGIANDGEAPRLGVGDAGVPRLNLRWSRDFQIRPAFDQATVLSNFSVQES